jgi:hypothetical protein
MRLLKLPESFVAFPAEINVDAGYDQQGYNDQQVVSSEHGCKGFYGICDWVNKRGMCVV